MSKETPKPFTKWELERHLEDSPKSHWNARRRKVGVDDMYQEYLAAARKS